MSKLDQGSESILKKDKKDCIINIVHTQLNICIGLKINPLYNFTLQDFTFIIHNKFSTGLFYNKKNELVIRIREDEKIKVLSEIITGSCVNFAEIKIIDVNLIEFYSLSAGLKFYNNAKIGLLVQEKIKDFRECLNGWNSEINKFKKNNSYFIFDITK